MADDNWKKLTWFMLMLEEVENRLTALESRTCAADAPATSRPNVEPAASAGASTVLASGGSAASSAGSGGMTTSPSDASFERPKTTPTTSSTTSAPAAAVASDPVSAAKAKPHAETAEEVAEQAGKGGGVSQELADLAAKLKRAVEVVRSVEWRGHNATCAHPNCHRTKWRAHAPDCPLAAVLKENA